MKINEFFSNPDSIETVSMDMRDTFELKIYDRQITLLENTAISLLSYITKDHWENLFKTFILPNSIKL
jgi:hypothetical protein